ncbi:MAG TPA: 16S rRNA (cytosine(967)-C(5))-methyltransferase RsmB [Erysipelothrix sp.]
MRKTAYEILEKVLLQEEHSHLLLRDLKLSPQDQAFVSALVYTVLQNKLYLSYQFEAMVDDNLPEEVKIVLLMGVAQYLKMDKIPEHALVNESVELVKQIGKPRYHGVVNAVLKKVIKQKERALPEDEIKKASLVYSMPEWILRLLKAQYDTEFAIEYAAYCQKIKPNYVRVNPHKNCPELAEHMTISDDKIIAKSSLFQTDLLAKGCVIIQDINSQNVVKALDLKADMDVLDCCCGPGTKTTQIADALAGTGSILGIELHESRVKTTQELLKRWGVNNAQIIQSDVLDFESKHRFDRILIDAPCSGLGVLSHKADLRYNIKPESLDELEALQAQILEHVSQFVKKSGIMVYATCTLNKKENEKQVAKFLKNHPEFTCVYEHTDNPQKTQGDGFYIAKLVRTC